MVKALIRPSRTLQLSVETEGWVIPDLLRAWSREGICRLDTYHLLSVIWPVLGLQTGGVHVTQAALRAPKGMFLSGSGSGSGELHQTPQARADSM